MEGADSSSTRSEPQRGIRARERPAREQGFAVAPADAFAEEARATENRISALLETLGAATRPAHININFMVIMSVFQSTPTTVHRTGVPGLS